MCIINHAQEIIPDLTTEVLVQAAPLLARASPMRHAAIWAGEKYIHLYIDWNGAVSPCVFVPYSPVNVKELYARGGTLDDVWAEPLFAGIRNWQEGYWQGRGNWLAPCIIRDHHAGLRRLIAQHEPEPADESARQALLDPRYARALEEYDERYQTLTEPLWKERYLRDEKR